MGEVAVQHPIEVDLPSSGPTPVDSSLKSGKSSWQDIAAARQAAVRALHPPAAKLDVLPSEAVLDVTDIPGKVLSALDREITETLNVTELLAALAEGKYTAVQVTTAFIHRASVAHQLVNCLSEVFFDKALKTAKALDEYYIKTGKTVGPLHGLPISLKDQIEVEGVEHNMSYVGYVGKKAPYNASLVEVLLKQGAVLYCQTIMSQGLWFGEGYNNVYGRTLNPFNRTLVSGGSSGGEGALVGLRGSLLGVGSDLGGSVRIPAAFQGVYGLRGSYSRIPYCRASNSSEGQETVRSVLGPLTASVDGLKTFTKAVLDASPWDYDPWTPRMPWSESMYNLSEHGGGPSGKTPKLCFAIMWDDLVIQPVQPYHRALEELKAALLAAGHEVIDWEPFEMAKSSDLIMAVFNADGGKDLMKQLALSGEPRLNDILDRDAKDMLVSDYRDLCFSRSKYIKDALDHWMKTASRTSTGRPVDAILAPTTACAPMKHNDRLLGLYTSFCNLADYTAAILPVTKVIPGLDDKPIRTAFHSEDDRLNYERYDAKTYANAPISIQVIGKKYEEEAVIRMTEIADAALKAARVAKE